MILTTTLPLALLWRCTWRCRHFSLPRSQLTSKIPTQTLPSHPEPGIEDILYTHPVSLKLCDLFIQETRKSHEVPWTMSALHYDPLDRSRRSIRLLEVLPGKLDDDIVCRLVNADLNDNPSYAALSYTWDQGHGLKTIICETHDTQRHLVPVEANLWDFLSRFREWEESGKTRLWIDALCMSSCSTKHTCSRTNLPARHESRRQ